jgi:hypothetical protein
MNCKKTISSLSLLAFGASIVGCAPDPKPFDPQTMQRPYLERAAENPDTCRPPPPPPGQQVV